MSLSSILVKKIEELVYQSMPSAPANILDTSCRQYFLHGLRDDRLITALVPLDNLTFCELLSRAVKLETALIAHFYPRIPAPSLVAGAPGLQSTNQVNFSGPDQNALAASKPKIECKFCRKPGHAESTCFSKYAHLSPNAAQNSQGKSSKGLNANHIAAPLMPVEKMAQDVQQLPVTSPNENFSEQNFQHLPPEEQILLQHFSDAQAMSLSVEKGEAIDYSKYAKLSLPEYYFKTKFMNPLPPARAVGFTPVASMCIRGVKLDALLDTGAAVSLISIETLKSIAKETRLNVIAAGIRATPSVPLVRNASGGSLPLLGSITLPVVCENGKKANVEFQILDVKLPYSLLIGANALSNFGFSLFDSIRKMQIPFAKNKNVDNSSGFSVIGCNHLNLPVKNDRLVFGKISVGRRGLPNKVPEPKGKEPTI